MPKIQVNSKELKTILKSFTQLSQMSAKRRPTVSFTFDPVFRIIMANETVFASATPSDVEGWDKDVTPYHFYPETLQGIKFKGKKVELSWSADKFSPLGVRDGKFNTALKLAVAEPDFKHYPNKVDVFQVNERILGLITNYLAIPFAYYKGSKEFMPIILTKDANGFLVAYADDGYSLARVETTVPVPIENFNITVPRYIMETLYSGTLTGKDVSIGLAENSIYLENYYMKILCPCLNETLTDFLSVYKGSSGHFITSMDFSPVELLDAIDPLNSIVADSNTSSYVTEIDSQCFKLFLKNREIGDAMIEEVGGVKNIANEKDLKKVTLHLHPKAFYEYTKLMKGTVNGKMMASGTVIYYEGFLEEDGAKVKVRYLFPTVEV